jgi:hypothetical protein
VSLLVSLAGLGVCVEDQINAVGFLDFMSVLQYEGQDGVRMQDKWLTLPAKAIHLDTNAPLEPSRVVIMPNLLAEMNSVSPSTFSWMEGLSVLFAL